MPAQEMETVAIKPNPKNNPTLFKIFQNVQYNVVQHKKYIKEMNKLYKNMELSEFRESFTNALYYLFTFGDTSANVDRVIQFVATFCTSLDDDEEFLLYVCEVIFNCQCVSGQSVRYRASQLLAALLEALGEDASLDNDLCDKLLISQTNRLQDTRGAVRCRAALALQRLQNPMDNDDPVTKAYRFHMSCDPSASVRRAVVMSLAKCIRNTRYVEERLCDVDEAVRRASFLYISTINVTQLKVRQRLHTLKVGLNERSPRVRRVVEEILIPGWLAAFQGNIIDLLKAIRLDDVEHANDSQYVAGKLLEALFKRLPISELLLWLPTDKSLRLIPADKLNKETAWYWRHLAVHLQKLDDVDTLETVLPDLVVLTGYIRTIVEAPCPVESEDPVGFNTRQHVLAELASLLRVYDTSDPVGRDMVQKLVIDVLTGDYGPLYPEVIKAFVGALELAVPEIWSRVEIIASVISELRDPEDNEVVKPAPPIESTEIKLQRARLRVSLNVAMEAQEEAVREQNYALATECKAKVDELQRKLDHLNVIQEVPEDEPVQAPTAKENLNSTQILKKCLLILNSALDTPQITSVTPQLLSIFNDLELELFRNPEILETALETIALYSMLDKDIAKENRSFFFANISRAEDESLMCTILRCIVDILTVHGLNAFEPDENESITAVEKTRKNDTSNIDDLLDEAYAPAPSAVIEILIKIMDGTNEAYRLIIVEGLCRLLILGHLESPGIISRLILLWFNPNTEGEDMLRQTIGIFFQTFPVTVEGAQEQIQNATLPTIRALVRAPSSSPISEIDHDAVVRFIVSLTKVNHELIDSQGGLGMLLVTYLGTKCGAQVTSLICRTLSFLSPPRDVATCIDLAKTLRELCQKITDKQSCRYLTRYLGALEVSERASINKNSTSVTVNEASNATGDVSAASRGTSLPQPIARSTHMLIDETVPEELEIDESSPIDAPQSTKLSEDIAVQNVSPKRNSDLEPATSPAKDAEQVNNGDSDKNSGANTDGSSSAGVTPAKKPRVKDTGKKKLSLRLQSRADNVKSKPVEKVASDKNKRSRAQRSPSNKEKNKGVVEMESEVVQSSLSPPAASKKGTKDKSKKDNNKNKKKKDSPPRTMRTRRSRGSDASNICEPSLFSSDDETELHTIVYEQDIQQEALNTSSDLDVSRQSKANVTVPESSESTDESEV